MSFNDLVKDIADVCPKFNNFALTEFVRDHIDNSHKFIALAFEEGLKIVPAKIDFLDYTILSPEERVLFELNSKSGGKPSRTRIPLAISHLMLVQYRFRFEGEDIYSNIYTPYMVRNMLYIKDKWTMIRKVILEKTFSRMSERDQDGVSLSPIRVNLKFNRKRTFRVESYTSKQSYNHFIITAKMFHGGGGRKICDITIIHYMLAKFGFLKTLKRFGISKSDVSFVTQIGEDTNKFEYFAGRKFTDNVENGPGLFLKVKKTLLMEDLPRKFVINVLYVCHFFGIQNIENVYLDKGSIWKVILGILSFSDTAELKAYSNAETHLKSVDTFIDPITKDRLRKFGVMTGDDNDIYDVLVHIFINIDLYMVRYQVQNLYNNRLDVANGIQVGTYAKKIFWDIYSLAKKTNISVRDVKSTMSFNPMMFKMTSSNKKDDSEHYMSPPEIVGDNFLLSGGLNKIRMGGRTEQRLHPSMLVVESIGAFVGKQIGKTGYVNPCLPCTSDGAIYHPDYARDIDAITKYLPK